MENIASAQNEEEDARRINRLTNFLKTQQEIDRLAEQRESTAAMTNDRLKKV